MDVYSHLYVEIWSIHLVAELEDTSELLLISCDYPSEADTWGSSKECGSMFCCHLDLPV